MNKKLVKYIMFGLVIYFIGSVLFGCTKESDCNDLTMTTYTNQKGYWNYCNYVSNEINSDLNVLDSKKVSSCLYSKIDTIYYVPFNCARSGTFAYTKRIKIE